MSEPAGIAALRHGQHTGRRRRVLGPVTVLVIMAALALVGIGLAVIGTGPAPAALGALFAMAPVVPAVAILLWIDRWEPEPSRMLLAAFLWGAGVATVAAGTTSLVLDHAWRDTVGPKASAVVGLIFTAPVFEELFKGLFLLLLLWFRRREFDGLVDGIVYAGLVGVGFAFTENVLYLGSAFADNGLSGGIQLFVIRCVFSPFAHPLFTSMTGIAVGIAARSTSNVVRVVLPGVGYLGAVALHALWNTSAGVLTNGGFWFVYVAIVIPLLGIVAGVVLWQRHREHRIIAAQLPRLVASGVIAPEEVRLLNSLPVRRGWERAAEQRWGNEAGRAVREYQTSVTELAFVQERLIRRSDSRDLRRWYDDLLRSTRAARVRAYRMATAGPAAGPAADPAADPTTGTSADPTAGWTAGPNGQPDGPNGPSDASGPATDPSVDRGGPALGPESGTFGR